MGQEGCQGREMVGVIELMYNVSLFGIFTMNPLCTIKMKKMAQDDTENISTLYERKYILYQTHFHKETKSK
jgi:hypothetical protein